MVAEILLAAQIIVSPGDDIVKARDRLREQGGGTLVFRGGEYAVSETLEFDERDDGLTIEAAAGEKPILTGGRKLIFKPCNDLASCDLKAAGFKFAQEEMYPFGYGVKNATNRPDAFITLYRNGKALTIAREPNDDYFRIDELLDATNRVLRSNFDLTNWQDDDDLVIHAYWHFTWSDTYFRCKVVTAKDGKRALSAPGKVETPWDETPLVGRPFALMNSKKALDRDDEWVFARSQGMAYIKNLGIETNDYVIAEFERPFISIKGTKGITIKGMSFKYGRMSAIVAREVRDLKIKDCEIKGFDFCGVSLEKAFGVEMSGCDLGEFARRGIWFEGGDRVTLTPSESVFINNEIYNCGLVCHCSGVGLHVNGCGVNVINNHFHDITTSAVGLNGNEHNFVSNLVERCVTESDDQGAVKLFGNPVYRGNLYAYNVFRNNGNDGRWWAGVGGAGIRFDDAICGQVVRGNLFDNTAADRFGAIQIHAGRDNLIESNIFIRCRTALSATKWPMWAWQKSWFPNHLGRHDGEDPFHGVWKEKYGDLSFLRDMPMVNTFRDNVIIGKDSQLFNFHICDDEVDPEMVGGNNRRYQSWQHFLRFRPEGMPIVPTADQVGVR